MLRSGLSVKYYKLLLENHIRLMKLRNYDPDEIKDLEDCFWRAVKARNFYEKDDCLDLIAAVRGFIPDEKVAELTESAQNYCNNLIRNDPIEKSEEYLKVIDDVEEKIDKAKTMDICFEYWALKARFLMEYGIFWQSPSQLNPNVMFD